jgi:hypothetical protein
MSNVEFTSEGKALLSKGLKYNMQHRQKHWIKTLAIEADSAINLLNLHEQAYMKQMVTQRLRRLIDKDTRGEKRGSHITKLASIEKKLIQNLQGKLEENNLMITKADKGNTLIIISKEDYHKKIWYFITQNKFIKIHNNYTNTQQKDIKTIINTCKTTR